MRYEDMTNKVDETQPRNLGIYDMWLITGCGNGWNWNRDIWLSQFWGGRKRTG